MARNFFRNILFGPPAEDAEGSYDESDDDGNADVHELCRHCEARPSTLYCDSCRDFMCRYCSQSVHSILKGHDNIVSAISATEKQREREIKLEIREVIANPQPATETAISDDRKNCLVCVNNEGLLDVGPKFMNFPDPKSDALLIVSFIGPTGTGKSTLMRHLCSRSPFPLSGSTIGSSAYSSFSADVQAYNSDTSMFTKDKSSENILDFILIDSEGTGGKGVPGILENVVSKMPDSMKEAFQTERVKHVTVTYPRLLYLFSDILVYLFTNPKQRSDIVKLLVSYGKKASARNVNQFRPALLIVFNKVAINDVPSGEWDSSRSTESWLAQGGEQSSELNHYFSSVKVLFIPDFGPESNLVLGCNQLESLKNLVHSSLKACYKLKSERNSLLSQPQFLRLFLTAVRKLAKDYDTPFDFYDLLARDGDQSVDANAYEFFRLVQESQICPQFITKEERFVLALDLLKPRLLDSFLLDMARLNSQYQVGINAVIPNQWIQVLDKLNKKIDADLPCGAVSSFSGQPNVMCETVKSRHENVHQSRKVYTTTSPYTGVKSIYNIFGYEESFDFPCHWPGKFQPCRSSVDLKKELIKSLKDLDIFSPTDYLVQHSKFMESTRTNLTGLMSTRCCLGCLLSFPTERSLGCEHTLCSKCCNESHYCQVCGRPHGIKAKNLPDGVGFRVLSLDGGGIRGVTSVLILADLQKRLFNMPITDFFDYIIGTSAGAITALGLTVRRRSAEDLVSLYNELGSRAFVRVSNLGEAISLSWYGYRYRRDALHTVLKAELGSEKLFSARGLPHVATVANSIQSGRFRPVLFASYTRPASVDDIAEIVCEGSTIDAAEASSAAGSYFPIFSWNHEDYTDGGMTHNNPCILGFQEASRLWPNKVCDSIVSVGTGVYSNTSDQLKNDIFTLLGHVTALVTDTERSWTELKARIIAAKLNANQICHRLNPSMTAAYRLDDVSKISQMTVDTKLWIQQNENVMYGLCRTMIAQLFYVDRTQSDFRYDEKDKCYRLNIKSRRPLPGLLHSRLNPSKVLFEPSNGTLKIVSATRDDHDLALLKCTLHAVPLSVTEVSLYCCVSHLDNDTNQLKKYPISGESIPCRITKK